jgi:hypothetical protein
MMRRHLAGALILLAFGAVGTIVSLTARAEGFWEKKDWKQWSKEDVRRMLEDSPWSRKFSVGKSIVSKALPSESGAAGRGAAGESREEIDYYFQLRSALPVREALVRDEEIKRKYDKMTEEEKKAFDTDAESTLSKQYEADILVHVVYKSNIGTFERALAVYWQSIPENSLPLDVFIITPRGDHVGPVRFISPKSGTLEFDLVFPRMFNGEPTIREGDKTFTIEFPHPHIYDLPHVRGYIKFDTDKMMFNGRLTY